MLDVILNALSFLVIIAVHEFGHYSAARRYGIIPPTFSVGFGPAVYAFIYKGTRFKFCPIPLGGAVSIPLAELEKLSSRKQISVLFAGPFANLVLSVCISIMLVMIGSGPKNIAHLSLLIQSIIVVIGTIFFFVTGVPVIIYNLVGIILHPINNIDGVSGPISILTGKSIPESMLSGQSQMAKLLITTYVLSLGIGTFNLLPLSMLDGGRIARVLLSRFPKFNTVWTLGTSVVLALLVCYVLVGDVVKLFAR